MAKKALGKGLNALIPDIKKNIDPSPQKDSSTDKGILEIPLSKIERNPYQPRSEFHEDKLQDHIQEKIQPGL